MLQITLIMISSFAISSVQELLHMRNNLNSEKASNGSKRSMMVGFSVILIGIFLIYLATLCASPLSEQYCIDNYVNFFSKG